MSTTASFNNMLKEYAKDKLLTNEVVKRDFLLSKLWPKADKKYAGGDYPVIFQNADASSIEYGQLTAQDDISENVYLKGSASLKEMWGSMIFHDKDIRRNGKISEQSFVKMLPDQIERFTRRFKERLSFGLLNGADAYALATVDGTAGGEITVDRPELLTLNQKVQVIDDDTAVVTGYIRELSIRTKEIKLYDARTGGAVVDLSAYTAAANAKVVGMGAETSANLFQSLVDALLPTTAGGSSTLYGLAKDATNPGLESVYIDGSSFAAATIMDDLFDALTEIKVVGRGNPTDLLMDTRAFGSVLKKLNTSKTAYNVVPGSSKVSEYGWEEVLISGGSHPVKLVGVNEMRRDTMVFADWNCLKVVSNGGVKKHMTPDGNYFTPVRATSGHKYITDICFEGELIVKPKGCGVIGGIVPANL